MVQTQDCCFWIFLAANLARIGFLQDCAAKEQHLNSKFSETNGSGEVIFLAVDDFFRCFVNEWCARLLTLAQSPSG